MQTAADVSIALTLPFLHQQQETTEVDLFYQTMETYHTLVQTANDLAISVQEDERPGEAYNAFSAKPVMSHLERYFDERPAPAYPIKESSPIQIKEAVHARAEIGGAAQEIRRLIREENYRYQDMVIYLRDSATYNDVIQTVFHDYDIPVFMDEKRTMLNHPLIEFIRSLFDVIDSNWRYDALFRLLKTGFIKPSDETYPLTSDAIDKLENYVLAYGIRSKNQWIQEEDWIYERFQGFTESVQTDEQIEKEQIINRYRQQVIAMLEPFDKAFRSCETVYERTETLYMFLEQLKIPEQLEEKRVRQEQAGQLEKAREEEQV